jgi:Transposase, Mutator family
MTTDPKKSFTPAALSELTRSDVDQLLQTRLVDFCPRELLGLLISTAGTAERSVYLEKEPTDKPNGFYDRSLQLGTIPIEVCVPRTRTGEFRPTTLPSRLHRTGYFIQRLDASGWQTEEPARWEVGTHLREMAAQTTISIEGRTVHLRAWRYSVHGVSGYVVPVYLLDTDLPENSEWDRGITRTLYGGDW